MPIQAISGVLKVDKDHYRKGEACIPFDSVPVEGADVGGAVMRNPIRTGSGLEGELVKREGLGRPFRGLPAHVVHVRQWVQEDRTSYAKHGGEMDEYVLDSKVTAQELRIWWDLGDEGRIEEIGFLCTGEAVEHGS